MVLRIPFLTFSNADIKFAEQKLIWKTFTITESLSTIRKMEFIDKKMSVKPALDDNFKAFVIYMTSLSLMSMMIHPAWEIQRALLLSKEVTILTKYADFAYVFSKE